MSGTTADPRQLDRRWDATPLTTWAPLMLLAFLVWALVLGFLGSLVPLPSLGLAEGDLLLMGHRVPGWATLTTMSVLLMAPAVVSVTLWPSRHCAVEVVRSAGRPSC